ncbi:BZ3500_MvSof-1268-A1-R1_Chr2-3g05315 [Microbotryum saponariae]|uniref:BZ3500_MvSof-1268-A1-R1_Chr2-3g05315 protein n=1 Tax=Microbotryum saponariae TaxID=289078 RepID=A0A2X0K6W1_9BASI|nr:BZ3500_MvSof-1268-A1-R1_Chr2-3g05315 [Microbotryum saponariae]SDA01181.1 BZ3501_MvSof-1269-A2-R1_Chr2-2g04988 [Microbotryum saponariae]
MPFTLIKVASTVLAGIGGSYAVLLGLLTIPAVQRTLIYLHRIRLVSDFDHPEQFGYAPGKVRNFKLVTPDGHKIGVWHVLPEAAYQAYRKRDPQLLNEGALPDEVFDQAFKTYPTCIYFHGNAATRAAPNRVRIGRHISEQDQSFVIIDYRGFGDSTGVPTEEGLLIDARTVWDYVTEVKGVPREKVSVMGQSLGTGVSIHPHALVLVSPFSSVSDLLSTYRLGNFIPVLSPLNSFPSLMTTFISLLKTRFDTSKVISEIKCPILILHARDDPVIPFSHSRTLANLLLAPHLNKTNSNSNVHFSSSRTAEALALKLDSDEGFKKLERDGLVRIEKWGAWGRVMRFERGEGLGKVVWAESEMGQHNDIGYSEPSLFLQREMMAP